MAPNTPAYTISDSEPDSDSDSDSHCKSTISSVQRQYQSQLSPRQIQELFEVTGYSDAYAYALHKILSDFDPTTPTIANRKGGARLMTLLGRICTKDSAVTFKDDLDALDKLRHHLHIRNPEEEKSEGEDEDDGVICSCSASCQVDDLISKLRERQSKPGTPESDGGSQTRTIHLTDKTVAIGLGALAVGYGVYRYFNNRE